jgi:choline dehydrogenase-like flavoprotein
MNSGHSMMAVGAMLLLSITILGLNDKYLNTSDVLLNTKFGVLAVSLGTSIIEEANGKAFDLAGSDDAITDLSQLTAPNSLGPAPGEYYPYFNDFDDFNGFTKNVTNMPSAEFNIYCEVHYVLDSDPSIISNVRTWHKRIDVFVTSPSMRNANNEQDTIKLSSVYSYWFFR